MSGGAPFGNQNGAKAKRWEASLERAWAAWPEKPDAMDCSPLMRGLNEAAYLFVSDVMSKHDVAFYRENADRLDGKAHQSIDASVRASVVIAADKHDETL